MTEFNTTYDGLPIANEKPFAACIVVYRDTPGGYSLLILHRAHEGPDHQGDWAWTPPSGARLPYEPILNCAARELREETGLVLDLIAVPHAAEEVAVYVARAPAECVVMLDGEHDRYEWLSPSEAVARCKPEIVGDEILAALRAVARG